MNELECSTCGCTCHATANCPRTILEKCIELTRQQAEWWDEFLAGRAKHPTGVPLFNCYYALDSMRKMLNQSSGESGGQ